MCTLSALVAQLDRVLGYEPSGQRFESSRARHFERVFKKHPVLPVVVWI